MSKDKNPKKGLGKGFDVLVPLNVDVDSVTAGNQEKVHKLALNIVVPKENQPRQRFEEEALKELAQSISVHGVVQPIIVTQVEQDLYSIIAGERRWRAAKIAGLQNIPAIIRSANEHEQIEISLLENIQRKDLTSLEFAATIYRLRHQFNQNYGEIAKRVGKAVPTILNAIRLLSLPENIKKALSDGVITEGHARAILSLQKFPKQQKGLFEHIVAKKWSVRQAEQFAIAVKRGQAPSIKKPVKDVPDKTATKLQRYLGAKKVTVQRSAKGSGKVVIFYKTEKDLDKIINKIYR